MATAQIETIQMLPFGMLNAFLLIQGENAILIDTGLPNSARKVEKTLVKQGLGWRNVKLIVLTHGHIDHAGSAQEMQSRTSAPILAHVDEAEYLAGGRPILRPTGGFGKLFQKTGAIERPFERVVAQIQMDQSEFGLGDFGFDARVVHTPGHTPGSVSVVLGDGRVIAGDLAASGVLLGGIMRRNRPKQPPFEEDTAAVAHALGALLAAGAKRFYLGHGGPLGADKIAAHQRHLLAAVHT